VLGRIVCPFFYSSSSFLWVVLAQDEAPSDALVADSKVLAPALRAQLPGEAPEPEAAAMRIAAPDERPATVQALEAAAFDDMADGSGDEEDGGSAFHQTHTRDAGSTTTLRLGVCASCLAEEAVGLLDPARLMSGWTASRVLAEGASHAVFVGSAGAPGLLLGGASGSSSGGPSSLRVEDAPKGAGVVALGMSSLRMEMSLRARLASLGARREERDRRYLALRRAYVAQLKSYALETKVRRRDVPAAASDLSPAYGLAVGRMSPLGLVALQEHTVALEALRDEVANARQQQPGSFVPGTGSGGAGARRRPAAGLFASDAEEWAAVEQVWRLAGVLGEPCSDAPALTSTSLLPLHLAPPPPSPRGRWCLPPTRSSSRTRSCERGWREHSAPRLPHPELTLAPQLPRRSLRWQRPGAPSHF
jgi:hypothetical protein